MVRRVVLCVLSTVLFLMGVAAWSASASQAASEPGGVGGFGSPQAPLVVPGVEALDEAQQVLEAAQAHRETPQAFFRREASHTAYAHLDAPAARNAARDAFPRLIDVPNGGPPPLLPGEKITGYPADNVARVAESDPTTPHGLARSVIETVAPIALETSPHHRSPVNLQLKSVGDTYRPKLSVVPVKIPKRLAKGISLGATGISLTPVTAHGKPLTGSEGTVDGTTVMYANTLASADTLVKPDTTGFSAETLLRSLNSPRTLYFRLSLRARARLEESKNGSGARIVAEGRTIATIPTPSARDSEGTAVPVSMRTSKNLLIITVDHALEAYRLPVAVDPTVEDSTWSNYWFNGVYHESAWHFEHTPGSHVFTAPYQAEEGKWTETISATHSPGEYGGLFYTTPGESQIVRAHAEGTWNDEGAAVQNYMLLQDKQGIEDYTALAVVTEPERGGGGYACLPSLNCAGTTAGSAPPENGNTAAYEQETTTGTATKEGINTLTRASVQITQEQGPTIAFNKSTPTIYNENTHETVPNILYGAGEWLGPHHGAFEVQAKDPGLGFDMYRVLGSGFADYREYNVGEGHAGKKCIGAQCPSIVNQPYAYNSNMYNGEDSLEAFVEDPVGLYAVIWPQKVKVDAAPPHSITVKGLQNGNELPLGETKLKVEATDDEGTRKSSGIKSIKLSVDGTEVTGTAASCPEGPCSASTETTLAARNFTSGSHVLLVTATDNASNVAQEEFTFRVHGATLLSVGPGSADPSSGELTLSASDASLGGAAGVSRTYQSRHLTAGSEGPFGPQWAINLGGGENLTVTAEGDAVLTPAGGARTTFARNSKGEFESPPGAAGLRLEGKEAMPGAGVSEYILSDTTAGTKTKFTQPTGMRNAAPVFAEAFGWEAKLRTPTSEAVDAGGDLWVANYASDLIEKFSPNGALLATFGSYGTSSGQYTGPWGVAINASNGNVYVSDTSNHRIEELNSTGAFIRTFGWGVKDNKPEAEVCETGECKPGITGSGAAQLNAPHGMATDSSGNLWVADCNNNRIEEFSGTGAFIRQTGSTGSGNGQFACPAGIAASNGKLYVTDSGNNRIEDFSASGEYTGKFGSEGTGNGQLKFPVGIATETSTGNLYVADANNNRVEEFTPAGSFLNTFGSKGAGEGQFEASSPQGVAVSSSGVIYAANTEANLVDEWDRPTWLPTEAGGPLSGSATTYGYTEVEAEGRVSTEPGEVLAPKPAGVASCNPLVRGCRALTFNYAKTKTATGENESQWGDYPGRLTRVYFHAWDPAKSEMTTTEIAHYLYDAQGRLRAEWDPRTETSTDCGATCGALKTTYGYDSERHVTAIRPAGQQPWAFVYGTLAGDPNTGRLLKVTRPKASTSLLGAETPSNAESPKITGTPLVGVKLGVTTGKWSGAPIVYGYQWEDCNAEHKACTRITGATNPNYTIKEADNGHTVAAVVTASAGGGSTAATVWTATVGSAYTQTVASGKSLSAASCIPSTTDCVVSESKGAAFYATNVSTNSNATWKGWNGPSTEGPSQALACATTTLCLLANGKEQSGGSLYYATSLGGSWTQAYSPAYGVDAITCPSSTLCIDGQDGSGFFRYSTNPPSTSWTLEQQATASMNAVACVSTAFCVIGDSKGNLHVATTTTQVESSAWKETNVDGTTPLKGVACSSTTSCVAVDTAGNAISLTIESTGAAKASKQNIAGTSELTAVTCITTSCTSVDAGGNIYTSSNGGTTWAKKVSVGHRLNAVSCATSSLCAAVDDIGDVITFSFAAPTEGETQGPQPGTTIEYNVPVTGGTGLQNLSESEVAKWGQKDDPVEGAAVVPPSEPQGWPASTYTSAMSTYWDSHGRVVNTAAPGGAIATSEYNATNDVTRTLGPDNRARALNETGKTAEASKLLDTQSRYNGETEAEQAHEQEEVAQGHRTAPEPGTELLETKGPQHTVKLAEGGAEVLARNHVRYFYDEGAPEAHHYGLLTKTSDGAEYEGKEADQRTTTDSYTGQGWTLRKPTSTTTAAGVLNVTKQTVYDEKTGKVIEATSPGASASNPIPTFSFSVGSWGNREGQFETPWGVAVSPKTGNVYVAAYGTSRVEEFSPAGKFIAWVGSSGAGEGQISKPEAVAVDPSGNIWVGDSGNERIDEFNENGEPIRHFGAKGTASGQFASSIDGIAANTTGVWVSDTGNDRIEKFSTTGTYESSFGKEGSGNGQFNGPTGITLSGEKLYVDDYFNHRVQQFTTGGEYKLQFGGWGRGNGQLEDPVGIAADGKTGDLYVTDYGSDRVEEFTATGAYVAWVSSYGSGAGQLNDPEAIATNTTGTTYVVDRGNTRVEAWAPGYSGARKAKTIYYTAEANPSEKACGEHPEWASLPCRTEPVGQPEDAPNLPTNKYSYNLWDEVTSTEETFGSTIRTKAETYDAAGRAVTSGTTASVDTPIPAVTNEYNSETGALTKQSSETGGKTKSITMKLNSAGRPVEYADAEGNIAKYEHEEGGDERLLEVSEGKGEELHASQTYSYDPVTGLRTKLIDSAASGLTFTAKYDPEGKLAAETYPGGLEAKYAYNPAGEATGLEYVKTTQCAEHCTWFADSDTPSVHGETLLQTSSLATERYNYDTAGRLTQAQEEPVGKACRTRLYGYDEESNRASLISREGSEGKCAIEGGATEHHAYDSANRLIDAGVSYETFGNTTKLPGADTGTEHELTSTYYADNQLESQSQNGETATYTYDPAGRTLTAHHSKPNTTTVDHYAGAGEAVTWTGEAVGVWTRNIPGLDGSLCATQTSAGSVNLQLHDLNGNIVATAGTSEAETKLQNTYNSTEFGVPQAGTSPPKYAWLGANGLATESSLGSGGIANPGGASYVPLIGRALQTLEIASPGAFPDGAATTHVIQATYLGADASILKGMAVEHEAQLQEAARKQAEEEARLRECPPTACGPWPTEEGPGEETFGDPVHCYVSGVAGVNGDTGWINGVGGCHEGLPQGTWIYVCVGAVSDAGVKTAGGCNHVTVEHHRSRHWAIGLGKPIHCESNEIIRALVEFYVPGGRVLYAGTENAGECGGGTDNFDEAALSLFGSPDASGVEELLVSFFRRE